MFKVINNHPNYSVSTDGIVKNNKTGRVLKQDLSRRYPAVRLGKFGGAYSVHRLVALSFIDNPENKPQVNHIDGCKTNNHVTNLEWNTAKENTRHAQLNGLMRIRTYPVFRSQKITKDEASEICEAYATGLFTQRELAKAVGISHGRINQLIHNKWSLR